MYYGIDGAAWQSAKLQNIKAICVVIYHFCIQFKFKMVDVDGKVKGLNAKMRNYNAKLLIYSTISASIEKYMYNCTETISKNILYYVGAPSNQISSKIRVCKYMRSLRWSLIYLAMLFWCSDPHLYDAFVRNIFVWCRAVADM